MKILLVLCIVSSVLLSCGPEFYNQNKEVKNDKVDRDNSVVKMGFKTPTRQLPVQEYPIFDDDLDFENMELAIQRQLHRFESKDLGGQILLGQEIYPLSRAKESLYVFMRLSKELKRCLKVNSRPSCYKEFNSELKSNFDVFAPNLNSSDPRFGEKEDTFFTAYYTPKIQASFREQGEFKYKIYQKPQVTNILKSSRVEVDFKNKLAGRGLELFYTKDLFELYLLHVQGGGKVVVNNAGVEKSYYISYAGSNKKKWRFISNYMVQKGMIANKSIEAQRKFLQDNPDRQEEIYSYCPSYVYFKLSSHPPEGSDSVPLTDKRSIATDSKLYGFKGLLSFIQAKKPKKIGQAEMIKFSRFMIDQDTGGAIKGKGRVDIYHGEGSYAEYAAYHTQDTGNLFFLMLKK